MTIQKARKTLGKKTENLIRLFEVVYKSVRKKPF